MAFEQEEYLEHRNTEYNEKTIVPTSFFRENFKEGNTSVLDENTSNAIQIGDLSGLVSEGAITKTGKEIVNYSVRNPLVSVDKIKEKHEALDEIRSNDKIRSEITGVLERVKGYEGEVNRYNISGALGFLASDEGIYQTQNDIRTVLGSLPKWSRDIPEPESKYLKGLVNDIRKDLKNSSVHKVAKGPIFRHLTKGKIYGLEEVLKERPLVSPLPFNSIPTQMIPTSLGFAGPVGTVFYSMAKVSELDPESALVFALMGSFGAFMGGALGLMVGQWRDKHSFLKPMKTRFRNDKEAINAYNAIGSLDELLAYDEFGRKLPNASLPEVSDSEKHDFFAEGLVNPLQSQKIENYIPNGIVLNNGQRLTFLTGPNSGGKTSLGKSIAQTQILAQIGCYVPADNAKINLADKIFYQVGGNDNLDDEEGGLGTQFKRTKNVLFSSTPKSLVVIDDLIEGTTFDEKTKHTVDQLYGFLHKGANVVYTSHHSELVNIFQEKGIGNFWQMEFDGKKPTHNLILGVSVDSHSDVVAERIGFDNKSIEQHLIRGGYLKPGQKLEDYQISRNGEEK